MTKYLLNYANLTYFKSQINNSKTGLLTGGFDKAISLNFNDLDNDFINKNVHILNQKRGAGFWLWKPYIILKTLNKLNDNDLLFYSDAGIDFVKKIDPLIPILDNSKNGIVLFNLPDFCTNKRWTKRDCFVYMTLDYEPYLSSTQVYASYIIMRKNEFVTSFINEWLKYAQDYRIITDNANECGLNNYPEFEDHRHDQSILSLLNKKYNITNFADITQYGNAGNQILFHHRNRI